MWSLKVLTRPWSVPDSLPFPSLRISGAIHLFRFFLGGLWVPGNRSARGRRFLLLLLGLYVPGNRGARGRCFLLRCIPFFVLRNGSRRSAFWGCGWRRDGCRRTWHLFEVVEECIFGPTHFGKDGLRVVDENLGLSNVWNYFLFENLINLQMFSWIKVFKTKQIFWANFKTFEICAFQGLLPNTSEVKLNIILTLLFLCS